MLTLFSPAKINLFLRIVSKRPDGYHNLSSLFQTLSLGDTLSIEPSSEDLLTCTSASLPTDNSNLILKAAALFRRKTGLQQAFKFHLIKRIPIEAGLGGGSSNAATTLWGCNQLCNTNIPLTTLQEWGAEIGSDIPFFLSEGTAHCAGRGEIVTNLTAMPSQSLWIVKPSAGLSTPEVYRRFKLATQFSVDQEKEDQCACQLGRFCYFNDLEAPAFEAKPELKQLKEELLRNGFKTVLMSGSGTAFFCIGQGTLPKDPDITIYPVTFLNRSSTTWYEVECAQTNWMLDLAEFWQKTHSCKDIPTDLAAQHDKYLYGETL